MATDPIEFLSMISIKPSVHVLSISNTLLAALIHFVAVSLYWTLVGW